MVGVLGGGQLGLFFVRAARRLGYRAAVLDPSPAAPAHREADMPIVAAYDDGPALKLLAGKCVGVTVELEAVPVASLRNLAETCFTSPSAEALAIAQDRLRSKRMLFPGILKTARNGYDGKGQIRVRSAGEVADAWRTLGGVPCVLEQEISWDA